MLNKIISFIKLLRPRQWIKNLAVFAAITFAGELFDPVSFQKVFWAFISFCALSSATYIINDAVDIKKDRLHPFKRFRPLTSGAIPVSLAIFTAILLIASSITLGLFVNLGFLILTIIYLLVQLLYSLFLKSIAIVDILAIASGYILRVYAGEFAGESHISVWLLLTVISVSLFLAIGKRRSELTLLSSNQDVNIAAVRKTLSHYSERLLDVYASIFATSTFISYALFTFLENPKGFKLGISILLPEYLPTFLERKWLMITIAPVVYGLMRYLQDIYEKKEGESPDRVLLSDKPLLTTVIIWALLVITIIYFVRV